MSPSSSLQTMGSTTTSILVSGSLLAVKEEENSKENEVDGEDKGAGGGILVL